MVRRRRTLAPLAVLMADIDHFKAINDRYGHAGGDRVLAAVGTVLRRCVREQDAVARWGGEEFLVMLPECDLNRAILIGERIREEIHAMKLMIDGEAIRATL